MPPFPGSTTTSADRAQFGSTGQRAGDFLAAVGVHRLFEHQVEAMPDAPAVQFQNEQWSYRDLNVAANRMASKLREAGVQRGTLVGVKLDRSAQMVAAVLGVLKAGAAYVPLDPLYPDERLRLMLDDSQASVVVTEPHYISGLAGYNGRILDLTQLCTGNDQNPTNVDSRPDDLAYVIYTSGSMGRPKGVQIEHRSVLNFLGSMQREPGLDRHDVLAAVTSLSFDIHVLELYLPLVVGARLVIVPREVTSDGMRLRSLLKDVKATIMQATPATWRLLLLAGWSVDERLPKAFCGGESMPRTVADDLLARCDEVWNLYGPTETTVWSTTHRVQAGTQQVPIGRAIDRTQLYVLDEQRQPVADGQAGELYIGGAGVARGYWNRPDLTAERFLRDPFVDDENARMYRTGDLVRWLPSRELDCLGRIDHQVKIRGYRVELGEIEAALASHPGVQSAVVHARQDDTGENHLVGYIVPTVRPGPSPRDFIHLLQAKLPAHAIPSAFVTLADFPLTPNGKIDRNALPAPHARPELRAAATEPVGEVESRLRTIWQDVLKLDAIGVEDAFLELGGDSLRCMKLLRRVEEDFGRTFFASMLSPEMTIRRLAELIQGSSETPARTSLVSLRTGTKRPLFLLPGVGGIPMDMFEIAPHFPDDRPIYTFRAPGLEDTAQPLNRVERLAAHYLNDLRTVQPRGPYSIAGWSFGALVAYEMGVQLQAAGEQAAYIGLIDEVAPLTYHRLPSPVDALAMFRNAVLQMSGRREAPGKQEEQLAIFEPLRLPLSRRLWQRIRRLLGRTEGATIQPSPYENLPTSLQRIVGAQTEAGCAYEPRRYRGNVFVYRTRERWAGLRPDKTDRGWGYYVDGDVTVRQTPGMHMTLLKDPNGAQLAAQITRDLESTGQ